MKGTGEKFKKVCHSQRNTSTFKGTNTLKTLLVTPKDKYHKINKSGVIYHFKCPHINCPDEYKGECGRALEERINEHLKAPSPIHQYSSSTGLPTQSRVLSTSYTGKNKVHPETSRKQCSSV